VNLIISNIYCAMHMQFSVIARVQFYSSKKELKRHSSDYIII